MLALGGAARAHAQLTLLVAADVGAVGTLTRPRGGLCGVLVEAWSSALLMRDDVAAQHLRVGAVLLYVPQSHLGLRVRMVLE